jgi:hypothetical protein
MTNEALYIKVHRPILGPPRPRVISITRHQRQAIRIAAYDLTSHGAARFLAYRAFSSPERPDAGQLRRMAKELRAAARAGDPAAVSLSAAQLVVAREHGFASWPRLMEHLEGRPLPVLSSLAPRRAVAASALDDCPYFVKGDAPSPEASRV